MRKMPGYAFLQERGTRHFAPEQTFWTEQSTKRRELPYRNLPNSAVVTYTVNYYPLPIHPAKEPLVYGIIQLDGADTGLTHIIGEVDPSKVHIGMRVEAVFKEQREGNILDIMYFRPVEKGGR